MLPESREFNGNNEPGQFDLIEIVKEEVSGDGEMDMLVLPKRTDIDHLIDEFGVGSEYFDDELVGNEHSIDVVNSCTNVPENSQRSNDIPSESGQTLFENLKYTRISKETLTERTENTRETCINFEAVKAEFERKGIHLPTEADFVQLFLDDEIISLLLSYTNKYKVIYIL